MTTIIDWIKWIIFDLPKPENLSRLIDLGPWWLPYLILIAIVFSETGLLVGFFLPGDSLLFAAGFLASPAGEELVGREMFNIFCLNMVLMAAAILGDAVNYYFGLQMEEHIFEKGRIRFIKHKHLMAAKHFYDRHGGKAIVLARFVPIVRTFTPFVAGVGQMSYRRFAIYNIAGGVGWVISMTTAGYFLGRIEWIQKHFEVVVLLIIGISVLPMAIHALRAWWQNRRSSS
jgi:membrane-associated protein